MCAKDVNIYNKIKTTIIHIISIIFFLIFFFIYMKKILNLNANLLIFLENMTNIVTRPINVTIDTMILALVKLIKMNVKKVQLKKIKIKHNAINYKKFLVIFKFFQKNIMIIVNSSNINKYFY